MTLFANNPNYVSYERKLREIRRLIAKGQGDSTAAEEIRDEMDVLWTQLDEREHRRLRRLSAELAMLYGKENPEPKVRVPAELARLNKARRRKRGILRKQSTTAEELLKELGAASRQRDFEGILNLLREHPGTLRPEAVAGWRSRAYLRLGHAETALEFQEFGLSIDPKFPANRLNHAEILLDLDRVDNAKEIVRDMLLDPDTSLRAVLWAAGIILRFPAHKIEASDPIIFEIIDVISNRLTSTRIANELAMAHFALADAYSRLGNFSEGERHYRDVLSVNHQHAPALIALGVLLYGSKMDEAASFLQHAWAISPNSTVVAFYLSHFNLQRGRAAEAKKFAEFALAGDTPEAMRPLLLSWRAAANLMLGTISLVRRDLEEASRLAPAEVPLRQMLLTWNEIEHRPIRQSDRIAALRPFTPSAPRHIDREFFSERAFAYAEFA